MRTIGNIIWLFLGGFAMGMLWIAVGIASFVSIVGIPWSRSCFVLASFHFWPFGRRAVNRELVTGHEDIGTGVLGSIGNIIWVILAGFWLALAHLIIGVAFCLTIILIPFGLQHFKLADLALAPVGMTVIPD